MSVNDVSEVQEVVYVSGRGDFATYQVDAGSYDLIKNVLNPKARAIDDEASDVMYKTIRLGLDLEKTEQEGDGEQSNTTLDDLRSPYDKYRTSVAGLSSRYTLLDTQYHTVQKTADASGARLSDTQLAKLRPKHYSNTSENLEASISSLNKVRGRLAKDPSAPPLHALGSMRPAAIKIVSGHAPEEAIQFRSDSGIGQL